MTDDERARFDAMEKQIGEIYAALFRPVVGEKVSLIEKLARVVEFSEKGEFVVSWGVKVVLTIGALAAAVGAIKTGFIK